MVIQRSIGISVRRTVLGRFAAVTVRLCGDHPTRRIHFTSAYTAIRNLWTQATLDQIPSNVLHGFNALGMDADQPGAARFCRIASMINAWHVQRTKPRQDDTAQTEPQRRYAVA